MLCRLTRSDQPIAVTSTPVVLLTSSGGGGGGGGGKYFEGEILALSGKYIIL